jgi:hypothetical protein
MHNLNNIAINDNNIQDKSYVLTLTKSNIKRQVVHHYL